MVVTTRIHCSHHSINRNALNRDRRMNRTLVWFRRDLRLADHAPLQRAAARGLVIPLFIFDRALLHHPETIDGDCPIEHYQWAMQAGVTHCADKTWSRIYNPQQVAVNRCDPEGTFIKHWLPELSRLPADQLGTPPPTAGYPALILDYRSARQARVQQLERQRQTFLGQPISSDRLASLPNSLTPFGADRFQSEIQWAGSLNQELFPPTGFRWPRWRTGANSSHLVRYPRQYFSPPKTAKIPPKRSNRQSAQTRSLMRP